MDFIIPRDTNVRAAQIQFAVFKKLSISERFEIAFELSDNLQTISKTGIQNRHPKYTNQQVIQAYLKLILNKSLFNKIYPYAKLEP